MQKDEKAQMGKSNRTRLRFPRGVEAGRVSPLWLCGRGR
jgi:hypothetical protein